MEYFSGVLTIQFREAVRLLDMVQKGLTDYLEAKRAAFPRYVLSKTKQRILNAAVCLMRVYFS